MGKGDKKSRRGKIILGTFGVRRPRKFAVKTEGNTLNAVESPKTNPVKERKEAAETVKTVKDKAEAKAPRAIKEKKEPKEKKPAEEKPKKEKKS